MHRVSRPAATLVPALAAACLALAPAAAAAQAGGSLRGFSAGGQLGWTRIVVVDDRAETGFGYALTLGYGLTESVSILADVARADAEESVLLADLGLRYSFAAGSGRLRPFLEAGGGWRRWRWKEPGEELFWLDDYERTAPVIYGAAGLTFLAAPAASFDFQARYGRGRFSAAENRTRKTTRGGEADGSTLQLRAGITWRPAGKR